MSYNGDTHTLAALESARAAAAERGHDRIATRHLLLGLLAVPESAAVAVLQGRGADLERLRAETEASLPRSRRPTGGESPPYSLNAQRVLGHAALEARAGGRESGSPPVRSEHLLFALLALDGDVARLLGAVGVSRTEARAEFRRRFGADAPALPFLGVDPDATAPVYQQIVDQIREAVADGRLRPGDRLPAVRHLAAVLSVAPGTTARAYQELEQVGIVATDGARGTRVAELRSTTVSQPERAATLVGLLRPVAVAASYLGASADEVRAALEHALAGIIHRGEAAPHSPHHS